VLHAFTRHAYFSYRFEDESTITILAGRRISRRSPLARIVREKIAESAS
jgi:hypothetical protein